MMFTVVTITIIGSDKLLRAFAAMIVLFLLTDASYFTIEFLKLLSVQGTFFLSEQM